MLGAWGESGWPPSGGSLSFCFWNAKGYVHYLNLFDVGLIVIPFCIPGSFHLPSCHKPI